MNQLILDVLIDTLIKDISEKNISKIFALLKDKKEFELSINPIKNHLYAAECIRRNSKKLSKEQKIKNIIDILVLYKIEFIELNNDFDIELIHKLWCENDISIMNLKTNRQIVKLFQAIYFDYILCSKKWKRIESKNKNSYFINHYDSNFLVLKISIIKFYDICEKLSYLKVAELLSKYKNSLSPIHSIYKLLIHQKLYEKSNLFFLWFHKISKPSIEEVKQISTETPSLFAKILPNLSLFTAMESLEIEMFILEKSLDN